MTQKGQGTIEYLVILAIIVVIALIVVGLLLQTTDVGGGIGESTAKTAWKSAEPFAIMDYAQAENDGNLTIVLKNNSGAVLDLTSFKITSNDTAHDLNTVIGNDLDLNNFAPNSTAVFYVSGTTVGACVSGNTYSYKAEDIEITYNTADITGRKQIGKSPLTGTCS
jgi:uncharacterized protein (UPF0333 family)